LTVCPVLLSAVPSWALDAERAILREQAATTGKAPKFLDRIVEGRLGRFYEDNCLLDQKFVMEENICTRRNTISSPCRESLPPGKH
jgi:translation elongation factor EF-Ts